MQTAELIDQLESDGPLLAAAAERAGWDAPVPGTRWTVRTLVTHVAGVHRWAAATVRTASRTGDEEAARAVGTGPDDDALLDWFDAGHRELVQTLRSAPADLRCFTFLPAPSPLAFWARRQAHETAVHRADAEHAAGAATPFPAEFAQDGLAELLQGFAARRSNTVPVPAILDLDADDGPAWRVVLGGERTIAAPRDADDERGADAVVAGRSSDLYLWAWNRPAAVRVSGDADVVGRWRKVRVRWS